jgi:transposase
MISSVRLDGTSACMTIEGATNTEVFQAYVREILVPTLRSGDIVVLDNLGAHKNEATLALISAVGAQTRFLPAYSPDLNPIELMWSKVKALLRAVEARSESALLQAISHALAAALGMSFFLARNFAHTAKTYMAVGGLPEAWPIMRNARFAQPSPCKPPSNNAPWTQRSNGKCVWASPRVPSSPEWSANESSLSMYLATR